MDNVEIITDKVFQLINYTKRSYLVTKPEFVKGRFLENMFQHNNSQQIRHWLEHADVKARIINIKDKSYLKNNIEALDDMINVEESLLPAPPPKKIEIIGLQDTKTAITPIALQFQALLSSSSFIINKCCRRRLA